MSKLAELDIETLNKVKIDSNKFDLALGGDCNFLDLVDKGLVEIQGEKDGELIYGASEAGRIVAENYKGEPLKLTDKSRKSLKRDKEMK